MPKTKGDYHHGDLKQALRDAAFEVLRTEGFHALSLRNLAKRTGVSPTAPYKHYTDLESLYADLADEGFHRLARTLNRSRVVFKDHLLLQFRSTAVSYVEFSLREPDLFQIMYGNGIADHAKYPALVAAEEKSFQVLQDIIADCQRAGLIRAGEIRDMATTAWVLVHGISTLLLGNQVMLRNLGRQKAKALTKQLVENLYLGLK